MNVTKPVFIVGSPRSGTTLVYQILAAHPSFAWISNWTNHRPWLPWLAAFSRLALPSRLGPSAIRRWPRPSEGRGVYEYCGIGHLLWEKRRALGADDVAPMTHKRLTRMVELHQRFQSKPRFVNKHPLNSMRIHYLRAIFPDARFIHVLRDGRAVALSMHNYVRWWQNQRMWWSGTTTREWEEAGGEPLVFSGRYWKRFVREVLVAAEELPSDQYLQIRYEDFVADPMGATRELLRFCGLPWHRRVERAIRARDIRNLNRRWVEGVSERSYQLLWEEIRDTAEPLGYH